MIDSEYAIPDDAVNNPAPSVSKSGKPFNLRPVSPTSPIGYNAPTLAALTHQKIRTKTITSKSKLATSRATPSAAATTLVKAFKGVRAATGSSSAIPPISSTTPSEQQLGTSANVPDAQASQSSVDAPQPIVADVQAKRKASTDTEAQPKRQRSMPIPTSAPMSSVIIPQEPTTDEVIEDILSASSADPHDILQVASSSQAQEIALKQIADEKHKGIGNLQTSGAELKQKILDLSASKMALLAELKEVEAALTHAQQEENQLPDAIKTLQQERDIQARKALAMKKKLKPVEGAADDDIKELEEADQIRLRAILAIQSLLNV
ncbi:uncharacterized protein [Miscanthus floridulus]|uniref:uncharacterized protein n=1 Tax=Miscanthus floridulus TaxID=154761 RepID=UPI00345B0BE6